MKKWRRFIPAILLVCCVGIGFYVYRPVPINNVIFHKDPVEHSPIAMAIRRMEEASSQTREFHEKKEIETALVCFQNISVRFYSRTDIIPIDPVLYDITFIAPPEETHPNIQLAGNGFVYANGNRYRITKENEAEIISYLESLF